MHAAEQIPVAIVLNWHGLNVMLLMVLMLVMLLPLPLLLMLLPKLHP